MKVEESVPLAQLTTFKVGGSALYFIEVTHQDDLGAALDYAQTRNLPYVLLAGGSNVLVKDSGFSGVVIHLRFEHFSIDQGKCIVSADAGASLMEVIEATTNENLMGMESMYGIPGTIGAAIRGNAGAFGTEVKDVLLEATALNIETREIKRFSNDSCSFSYRSSFFKKNPSWIVLSGVFALRADTEELAKARAEETLALRNERQIQNIQSAGSFFMNPLVSNELQELFEKEKGTPARENRVPAGWLIDKSGLKGFCENGACTGVRSANYILNDGTASAQSIKDLAEKIQNTVFDTFGVELQEEVTLIGF